MDGHEPDFIVVGDRVALGPLRRDLATVYARWMNEPEVVEFTVYDRKDSAPVGTAGLLAILHAHGNAEFAIFLGERRGQGLGTEATRLVLDFAFHVLQLRNVLLETLEWNAAGLAAYERAGFRRIGVRRGARISRGQPTDVVLMDAVPQDFGASVLR
jgi:diamine N-acetyltransferase